MVRIIGRGFSEEEPYYVTFVSGGITTQVARSPWPKGMYIELVSARVSNPNGAAAQVILWDQDLSGGTATTAVGSAGNYIASFGAGAGVSGVAVTTAEYGTAGDGPNPRFYAGIVGQASVPNLHLALKCLLKRG